MEIIEGFFKVFQITLFVIVVFLIFKLLLTQLFGNVFSKIYHWFMR